VKVLVFSSMSPSAIDRIGTPKRKKEQMIFCKVLNSVLDGTVLSVMANTAEANINRSDPINVMNGIVVALPRN